MNNYWISFGSSLNRGFFGDQPKWIQSIGHKNSGLVKCPKCGGDGYYEVEFRDWTSSRKCNVCFGYGEIPKRIENIYKNLINKI